MLLYKTSIERNRSHPGSQNGLSTDGVIDDASRHEQEADADHDSFGAGSGDDAGSAPPACPALAIVADVERELGAMTKAEYDPREPAYWKGMLKRDQARLTHRIKTLYGFFTLMRFVEDEAKKKKAEESLLYLMA